jgi:hypothetical protein
MKLPQPQYVCLLEALQDAFPTKQKLSQFVREALDKNLESIAIGEDLKEVISKLIQNAEDYGWESELIMAAGEANPKNQKLSIFIRSYERGYWQRLEAEANFCDIDENQALLAFEEVLLKLTPIFNTAKNYSPELRNGLTQIFQVNESNSSATHKIKFTLPLIPVFLNYEVELDLEKSLRVAFQPIRKLLHKVVLLVK